MRITQTGLLIYDEARATPGFTILSPQNYHSTFLIGRRGEVLHEWKHHLGPGNYAHLLPSGNLLWSGRTLEPPMVGGGKGGHIQEKDWDGNVVWEYRDDAQHHDFRRLANGNTLYIGWEAMPAEAAARVQGGVAGTEDKDGIIWGDYLREVTPAGETAWEWHAWEEMEIEAFPLNANSSRKEFAHCNACAELPNGDIMLSFRRFSVIAIVDKKTKKLRWHMQDDAWGQQHDCEMLENGNILFFANGLHVPGGGVVASRVIELNPETREIEWEYKGAPPFTCFSPNISGSQRLWSGNTLICEGISGRIFEVTPGCEIVWEFVNPWFGKTRDGGMSNAVFRSYRYAADSPEIVGRLNLPG